MRPIKARKEVFETRYQIREPKNDVKVARYLSALEFHEGMDPSTLSFPYATTALTPLTGHAMMGSYRNHRELYGSITHYECQHQCQQYSCWQDIYYHLCLHESYHHGATSFAHATCKNMNCSSGLPTG